MTSLDAEEGPITQVREGMEVVDSAGERVGTVRLVKMSDPGVATSEGQDAGDQRGLVKDMERVFGGGEPDVEPAVAERLMRLGYLKVDPKGLLRRDFYVAADEIATVDGEIVKLTAPKAELF